jgi:hypothetical protein
MYAVKANKVYTVDEVSKAAYLRDGYDVYDDSGKLLERSPKATVPYKQYAEVVKQRDEALQELEELKSESIPSA